MKHKRFNKKGIELSINVIIIAAISLIVLVLLSYLVIKNGGNVQKGTGCESIAGSKCVPSGQSCGDGFTPSLTNACQKVNDQAQSCCIPVSSG